MKKYFTLLIVNFSFVFCVYNVGQTVSLSDQQLSRTVCYESTFSDEYQVGDSFSLYDLNGDYNGGTYHVMFFDMSATWWGPCATSQQGPVGSIDTYLAQYLGDYET